MLSKLTAALPDHYRVERELGAGGMATVYLAHDLRHGRKVAIKVLRAELLTAIGPERFLREIAITATLDHPHILPLLDSGKAGADPILYYVMPFVEGESLRDRLGRERQLPLAEAIQIAREVADALAYSHARGVVHRDIKPENILLANGHARVADFGIARAVMAGEGGRLTETGMAIGTPAYMSPEQATGEQHIDGRTDIYALGCVFYEMIAGEPPYDGPTPHAILARSLSESPRPLEVIRPGLPPSLETIIHGATARVPADRFQTASEFASALARLSDRITMGSEPRPKSARRPRRVMLMAGVGAVLLGAVVVGSLVARGAQRRQSPGVIRPVPDASLLAIYQRGVRGYERRTTAGINDAIAAFAAAARQDPRFSLAWSGLAKAYIRAHGRRFEVPGMSWDSVLRLAVLAADAALATDSTNPDAWLAQAQVNRHIDPADIVLSNRAARRALALDSNLAAAWHELAIGLADSGDLDAAMEHWRRSVVVNPRYTQSLSFIALAHYWRREYDSAAMWVDSSIAVDPTFLLGRSTAGYIEIARGDYSRAGDAFEAARRIGTGIEDLESIAGSALTEASAGHPEASRALLEESEAAAEAYVPPPLHLVVYRAQAYAALRDVRRAISWLSRYQPRRDRHFQLHLRCDPAFDALAGEPAFHALLIRVSC